MALTFAELEELADLEAEAGNVDAAIELEQEMQSRLDARDAAFADIETASEEEKSAFLDNVVRTGQDLKEGFLGAGEAALTIGSGIVAEPAAGISGALGTLNPTGSAGEGERRVEGTREALTIMPTTQRGEESVAAVGEALAPIGEFISDAEQFAGDFGFSVGESLGLDDEGKAMLAATATASPEAAAMIITAGTSQLINRVAKSEKGVRAIQAAKDIQSKAAEKAKTATQKATEKIKRPTKGKQQIADILNESPTDVRAFGFELDDDIKNVLLGLDDADAIAPAKKVVPDEAGNVLVPDEAATVIDDIVPDQPIVDAKDHARQVAETGGTLVNRKKAAKKAEQMGLEKLTTQFILGASKADKIKFRKILEDAKLLRRDKGAAENTRLTNTVGESLNERVKYIFNINKKAGKRVNEAAADLSGKNVEIDELARNFYNSLSEKLGVDIVDGKPRYFDSLVEDFPNDQKAINNMLDLIERRLGDPDAKKMHDLKKRIDRSVTFGKQSEGGLSPEVERALKSLRADINKTLGNFSPEYRTANTIYSETIDALDELQGIGGKRLDLEGDNVEQALGVLSRRLAGNAVSSVPLKDAINAIEAIARKYGGDFDDSLFAQLQFAEDMNSMFGLSPQTSFKGEGQAVAQRAAQMAAQPETAAIGFVDKAIQKARGINEENAFKAIEALLEGQ